MGLLDGIRIPVGEASAARKEKRDLIQLKLTTDYAVHTLMCLAEYGGTGCSSAQLSERLNISRKHLIRISVRLREAEFLVSRPAA